MAKYDKVRPLALAIIRHEDHIFVAEGGDKITRENYFRPIGGKIEYGEYGMQTVAREIHEEIHELISDVKYVGTIESIFPYKDYTGHEITLFYTARFSNPALYDLSISLRAEEEEILVCRGCSCSSGSLRATGAEQLGPEQLRQMPASLPPASFGFRQGHGGHAAPGAAQMGPHPEVRVPRGAVRAHPRRGHRSRPGGLVPLCRFRVR